MPLDETDIKLGETDPQNAPQMRAWRVIQSRIEKLEDELSAMRFVRDVLFREIEKSKPSGG